MSKYGAHLGIKRPDCMTSAVDFPVPSLASVWPVTITTGCSKGSGLENLGTRWHSEKRFERSCKHKNNMNKVSARCQQGVSKVSARCQQGVSKVSARCQQGVSKVSARCQQGVSKVSARLGGHFRPQSKGHFRPRVTFAPQGSLSPPLKGSLAPPPFWL